MEPPRSHVRGGAAPGDIDLTAPGGEGAELQAPAAGAGAPPRRGEIHTCAGAACAVLEASSSGEVVLLAVLLGVASGDVLAGVVALLSAGAAALRWGSTSLDAVAGAQSVLGPAAVVGPLAAAASTWCASAALVLVKAPGRSAILFGTAAGLVSAGPGGGDVELVAVRVAGAATGAALALGAQRWAPAPARPAAAALAAAALALAVLA